MTRKTQLRQEWRNERRSSLLATRQKLTEAVEWIDTGDLRHRRYRWLLEGTEALVNRIDQEVGYIEEGS